MDELLQFWDSKETGTGGETKIEYLAEGPLQWARVWWAGTDEDEATVQAVEAGHRRTTAGSTHRHRIGRWPRGEERGQVGGRMQRERVQI